MAESDLTIAAAPHLRRALGQWDLVLLFVAAVSNLNLVPVVAAGGPATIWLWLLALLLFFWPQGIAVIELASRYPGEGGIYLWTKELFGDFHGFLSGWCYWTNNVFYIPTLLFYLVGVAVYVGGMRAQTLGENRLFVFALSLALLWLMVGLNIRGLGVGKWVNNLGGIGTVVVTVALVGLAAAHWRVFGLSLAPSDFRLAGGDQRLFPLFGVICFGFVGLELASVMGDEIRDPRKTLPRAVVWGGVLAALLYLAATLAILLALPQKEISVVQGILQAITRMARDVGVGWVVTPVALLITVAIAGTTSAWLAGSARIPFVAGLDRYLPPALGRTHPRFETPHIALLLHATVSCLFIAMSFIGATVEEAYKVMLLLAVVLQLVPFLYMYAAVIRLAARADRIVFYKRSTLWLAGLSGFITTAVAMAVAFFPPSGSRESVWLFEIKMLVGCAIFLGLAMLLFFVYSRRKAKLPRGPIDAGGTGVLACPPN